MKVYKITDKDGYTRRNQPDETLWGENITHKAKAKGRELCSSQIIHGYKDPYLAVLMNPIHGSYDAKTMLLWEAKGRVVADDGTKSGCKTLTTIKQIPVPQFTTEQLVEIAIRCAMKVCTDGKFQEWALNWITGKNRTANAACAAYAANNAAYAANAATYAAANAATYAAANAAAYAAADAARAAAYAIYAAADVDLIAIIREVIKQ